MPSDQYAGFAVNAALGQQYYKSGFWLQEDFWTTFEKIARERAGAVALIDGENSISFEELVEQAIVFGSAARQQGLGPKDIMIIHGRHCIQAVVAIAGCAYAGIIPALLPAMFSVEQIDGIIKNTQSRAILGVGEVVEIERTHEAAIKADLPIILLPDEYADKSGTISWSSFTAIKPEEIIDHQVMDADELLLLIYSSGTTGTPKGVMHSSNTARFAVTGYAAMQDIGPGDVCLVATAFGFVGSSLLGFYLTLLRGCTTVLSRNWSAESALVLIARHSVTHFLLMPTHAIDILSSDQLDTTDCSTVSRGVIAGVSEAYRLDARERLCAKPFPMYGMSESPAHVTGCMTDDWDHLRTTEGRWMPGTELLICDDDDQPVSTGTPGNILVRGPNRFLGYYRAEELNRSALTEDGYFRTGDIGVVNDDGFMTFVSRSKDIIRRGGVTITPGDIESALRSHPRLSDVAVIGLPDARLGERACACVITRDGKDISLEDITGYLAQQDFARYLWPESVQLCEEFPRTPSLKIQKNALRQIILKRLAQDLDADQV